MNIYFCGSIKGGRRLLSLYSSVIKRLKLYGTVLTEHIGDENYAKSGYAPAEQVYRQDVNWLDTADVVVAEITVPSLGVGYELAYAEAKGKRVICFYDNADKANISSMIIGNKHFLCYGYNDVDDLINKIDAVFTKED